MTAAPVQQSYATPVLQSYAAPIQQTYSAPLQTSYAQQAASYQPSYSTTAYGATALPTVQSMVVPTYPQGYGNHYGTPVVGNQYGNDAYGYGGHAAYGQGAAG